MFVVFSLLVGPVVAASFPLIDLFHQLDSRLPNGQYRIPSLVKTTNGTLLAFIDGRLHRRDLTPTIVYMRRSVDDGNTWAEAIPILSDPTNHTEFSGEPVVDPRTGTIHFIFGADQGGTSGCIPQIMSSTDDGLTWSPPMMANVSKAQPANASWGGMLASGIALTRGPFAGRLVIAMRAGCGNTGGGSYALYSDDGGATWAAGVKMVLLPEYGGGWTECEVAELRNGSVLLSSRNFYGLSSGQGPRLFARSDDGGATWAANWSAGAGTPIDLPDPYCEGSIASDPARSDTIYFGNPSNANSRKNFSIHASHDGGRSWPESVVVYPGGSAYSDLAFTRNGSLAMLFEKDGYNTVAFGVLPLPWARHRK